MAWIPATTDRHRCKEPRSERGRNAFAETYHGNAHQDSAGLMLDKRSKGYRNLARRDEDQQAQSKGVGRGLNMPLLKPIIRIISGTGQQSNCFTGRHGFV
jgi:hypothetical protein